MSSVYIYSIRKSKVNKLSRLEKRFGHSVGR